MTKINYPVENPHALSVEEVLTSFQTNNETGLKPADAENRSKDFGLNVYEVQKQKSIFRMVLHQFKSPIV